VRSLLIYLFRTSQLSTLYNAVKSRTEMTVVHNRKVSRQCTDRYPQCKQGTVHLTVEFYTVFICQQSYLLLFGIRSLTHSFIPSLKPSFSANPSYCSPSFLLLKYTLRGFPRLFTVISEHICFLLLVFFPVFTLLVVGSVR